MPPTDASADAGPVPVHPVHPGRSGPAEDLRDCEDTLDLRLPDEFIALFAGKTTDADVGGTTAPDSVGRKRPEQNTRDDTHITQTDEPRPAPPGHTDRPPTHDRDLTVALHPDSPASLGRGDRQATYDQDRVGALHPGRPAPLGRGDQDHAAPLGHDRPAPFDHHRAPAPDRDPLARPAALGPLDALDLLDQVGTWGPIPTPVGSFHLVPVHVERDLPIIGRWMNDPAVAAFWQLAGSREQTEGHLRGQLTGDGRSVPCLGLLDGTPMSYWEIYRADLDPLARHYPARPHDTGIHLLIGDVADRRRGLGSALLRAVADLVLDQRPACARVVAEPDLRNTPSVAAFLNAGFRYAAEVDLPVKRAALMIRDRSLRHLM
ncbi:GNAT family N-acetyltransferase [Streptomyces sp. NPDC048277]|uniref:GNAT family N-acetyltransferase n=1 Tax=Streptomyces sp. NPDC048277 TaxID=3155027 RepID=UPI0033D0BFF9